MEKTILKARQADNLPMKRCEPQVFKCFLPFLFSLGNRAEKVNVVHAPVPCYEQIDQALCGRNRLWV